GPYNRGHFTRTPTFANEATISTVAHDDYQDQVLYGTTDGRFAIVDVEYEATFPDRGGREVSVELRETPLLRIGREGVPLRRLTHGDSGTQHLVAATQEVDGRYELHVVSLVQQRSLLGAGEVSVERSYDLTEYLDGKPEHLAIPSDADAVLIGMADGSVLYLSFDGQEFSKRQVFIPFEDLDDRRVATMDFLLGDVSLVLTGHDGANRIYSVYRDPELGSRIWGHTKTFPDLERGAVFYSAAMRNKAFLIGDGRVASLRYGTTESIRWEEELPFTTRLASLGRRYDRMLFLDDEYMLHFHELHDPHPQAAWRTYFGKIQYEGQAAPEYSWQSTGGRDDFERKLSLVPLIIGTLKGTLYAMIFALPIALLAAIYTSQFLHPGIKRYVKPTMEIMASLPSVVLGFLAALWLAPIVSNAVPSMLLATSGIVLAAFGVGYLWGHLPRRLRMRMRPGYEFLAFVPVMLFVAYAGWHLGAVAERLLCVVEDPETGLAIADFRLWFSRATGLGFEQRNAFVVGFVMGFAVIPIIFTITEDALSNVPEAFRSGSLALGASRWQTAIHVVLPTASAGIFSAVMIGLGRAVGETMIVVMATGNTPVTELNPFTGMRTLSANIAVELPEAPYLGTLYRTLFLGAMVLFLMTFVVNTVAEIMRQRLREKYRAVE
ncbi:MAG: ABC transporter permease subunit, partial [Planctomycetota bacterium]